MATEIGEVNNPTLSVDDVADKLGEGIEPEKKTRTPPVKLEDNTETELEEQETELEGEENPDEEDENKEVIDLEDEIEYNETPRRQAILKEYPELFKKFPTIEKSIYREQQYAEVFPSIADAKTAKEELSVLNTFRSELLGGNVGNLLKSVKDANPKALAKIADEFIFTLGAVDQNAQFELFNQIGKSLINQAFKAGQSTKNEQLQYAAQHLHNFFYNTPEVQPYQRQVQQQENPEATRLSQERYEFESSRLNTAVSDITTRVDNVLKNTVNKHIDPNGVMTPYIKRNATTEAIDQIRVAIRDDKRLQGIINKLYENAHEDGYSETSKNRIKTVLLKKAQSILSDTIKKVQADALKGLGSRNKVETRDEKPLPRGRTATPRNNSSKSSKDEVLAKTRGMNTADALNALMGE